METVLERFLRYVKIDTQSDSNTGTHPSTAKQFDLLNLLVKELETIGCINISLSKEGKLFALLPALIFYSYQASIRSHNNAKPFSGESSSSNDFLNESSHIFKSSLSGI